MVTILLERQEFIRATHFTSADLFLGDGGRIEIVNESRRQFTSVDSSIVQGPIRTQKKNQTKNQNLFFLHEFLQANVSCPPSHAVVVEREGMISGYWKSGSMF